MNKRPTIDDVAKRAKVGRTTVSRVLNNGPNVREEVRERVQAAIDELGYRVNAQARHLASGSGRQLILIHATESEAEPNSYYHSGLELGAMRACAKRGYSLVTHTALTERSGGRDDILEFARSGNYDGIILTPPYSDDIALIQAVHALECPVVCIAAGPEARNQALWVSIDDHAAGLAIGHYLLDLGHRRFGYIDGLAGHVSAGLRLDGFMEALDSAGLGAESVQIARGNFTFRSGVEIAATILNSGDRPTALVCANDDMAAGALLSAHKLGLDIPRDISITGFDDTPVSEIVWPPLTTIHQPIRTLGSAAVERLILGGAAAGETNFDGFVDFWMVERDSTSAPVD